MEFNFLFNLKRTLFILLMLFCVQNIQSQETSFWSKVRVGGNIGIGLSGTTFSAVIAPSAVYDVTSQFSLGLGVNFGYTDGLNFIGTNYGASLISLYKPFAQLELSVEFEQMGVSRTIEIGDQDIRENYWYPALFIGAAYRVGFISAGIRYDVLYNETKSIYASAYAPFVRVFF